MGKSHKGAAWRAVRQQVLDHCDGICAICGDPLDTTGERYTYPHKLSASVDHIIPVTLGGAEYDLENLQAAHLSCNRRKWDKPQLRAPLHTTTTRRW